MDKVMYDAGDIAEDLSIPLEEAEKQLRGLADRMEKAGHLVIRGMVPRAYYEKQKGAGFLLDEPAVPGKVYFGWQAPHGLRLGPVPFHVV